RRPGGARMRGRMLLLAVAAALPGCAVGPDFKTPPLPQDAGYGRQEVSAHPPPDTDSGQAQRMIVGGDIPRQWWSLFRSAALDERVSDALKRSPTLYAARAALRQAQELTASARGSYSPQLAASYGFTRQQNATGTLSPTLSSGVAIFNLHTAQVSVSYL